MKVEHKEQVRTIPPNHVVAISIKSADFDGDNVSKLRGRTDGHLVLSVVLEGIERNRVFFQL